MANATTLLLTVALLVTPIILFMAERLPKWLHKFPFYIVSLVVLHRIFAFWKVDLTDSQVVGFLPSDITGIEALLYIFSGPDGLMLGLLFGFSIGLAIRTKKNHEYRWAAFIWILILGWEISPDGFSSIPSTSLSSHPSVLDWQSLAYPIIGLLLSMLVIPTLVQNESNPSLHLAATFSILIAFIDLTNSPIAWMLLGLTAHRSSALRVDALRGIASRKRWVGLLLIFMLTFGLLSYVLVQGSNSTHNMLWASRFALGWIGLCGICGALTPLAGFDAHPRPEAWGFLSGMILAPSLLPNLFLIEIFQLPLLIIAIVMPWVGTLPEERPKLSINRRLLELILLLSVLPIALYLSEFLPTSFLIVLLVSPLFLQFSTSVQEEE